MADQIVKSYLNEILQEFTEEGMVPLYPQGYFSNRNKRNKCPWLKLGKHGYCGKLCNDAYCARHTRMIRSGIRPPFPYTECCIGTKNSGIICKKCGQEKKQKRRQRRIGQILAQSLENKKEWGDAEISSYFDD